MSVYRNWLRHYTATGITDLLALHGFEVKGLYIDLTGTPNAEDSERLGVVAQKIDH